MRGATAGPFTQLTQLTRLTRLTRLISLIWFIRSRTPPFSPSRELRTARVRARVRVGRGTRASR
ncbi:hypothetical protein ACWDGI_00935 [Streptomyces sp. NPDC001220]